MNITKRKYCLYIDDIIVAFPASYLKKKKSLGTREMDQQLLELAVLVFRSQQHVRRLTTACNSSFREFNTLF